MDTQNYTFFAFLDKGRNKVVWRVLWIFFFFANIIEKLYRYYIVFKFIYLLAVLGLPCCLRTFSSCGKRGLLLLAVLWASH